MFSINVFTENKSLIELLDIEATNEKDNLYSFSSIERATKIFSRYVYHTLKKDVLEEIVSGSGNASNEMETFIKFIPYDYERMWEKRVFETIEEFFENENVTEFFVEGFITFRLSQLKNKFYEYLKDEYEHFSNVSDTTESIDSLIDFMKAQTSQADELVISTFENGEIVMSEGEKCFYIEENNEQENIVVQSVFISPKQVKVIDEYDVLSRASVLVLKQLFGRKIEFV